MLLGTVFPPPSVGLTVNEDPEQIAAVWEVATIGPGFTVKVKVFGVPEHAGPYANTTAKDLTTYPQGSPKVAISAGIVTEDCPIAKAATTEEDVKE
jgi:hypothetical protein